MTRLETLQAVFAEQEQREADMAFRNPWVPLFYNWVIAIALLALAFSFCKWGWDIHVSNRNEKIRAEAVEAYQAEQLAAAEAEANSEAAQLRMKEAAIANETTWCAKAVYGIRLFIDKYHYTEDDIRTYLRSMFNRADAKGVSLYDVLFDGQYLACDERNPVLEDYNGIRIRKLCEEEVRGWHDEGETKPVDPSYQFAELTPNGVYLTTELNADGYARRWQYA